MTNYRYSLSKQGKHICPKCNKKTFVLYINNATSEPLHSAVGKCDRADKCAHHYPPKQYFLTNKIIGANWNAVMPSHKHIPKKQRIPSYVNCDLLQKSMNMYYKNDFVQYLLKIFGEQAARQAIKRYLIGTSKVWGGATVFWQIDYLWRIRTGKIMQYNSETGKRIKQPISKISWVHSVLKLQDFSLAQCFFGEHLLRGNDKPVAIVESEKTAIIASIFLPEIIWLACGGSEGLNINKCQVLQGRNVILFPDCNMFDKWHKKAQELSLICNISVSDLIETVATEAQREQGYDLADYLVSIYRKQ